MPATTTLADHPRLYVSSDALARLTVRPRLPYLSEAAERVALDAAQCVKTQPIPCNPAGHNGHLGRARTMQQRVVTLLARLRQTGRREFRDAALRCVEQMGEWREWSWIAWREGDRRPEAIFDLSYGENSTTLALAYDWLHEDLDAGEKRLFLDVARHWAFASGRVKCKPGASWWFGSPNSNWNTVCAGGLGMLCLAMHEDVADARKLLPLCEESVRPFMELLDTTDGAWPEGVGYWNFGMRYAYTYLLSHEAATGRPHPLLGLAGARKTLSFPQCFCPHGQACSFGDVNHWHPMPFHYAAAQRLKDRDVARSLDSTLKRTGVKVNARGDAALWLALHSGRETPAKAAPKKRATVRLFGGLDWGIIADRMPDPRLYAAVRGGTTRVPHGHMDLLSYHCVVGDEKLITDVKPSSYLDTTFGSRRWELFEMNPQSKNTIFINGVGIAEGSTLDSTRRIRLPGAEGLRLEATTAMGDSRGGAAATFCGRVVLLVDGRALLVADRILLPYAGRVESRMHTFGRVKALRTGAAISGEREKLRVACAANVPAMLQESRTAQTDPTAPQATALRWCTAGRGLRDVVLATLLSPGGGAAKLKVEQADGRITFSASSGNWSQAVTLTDRLGVPRR